MLERGREENIGGTKTKKGETLGGGGKGPRKKSRGNLKGGDKKNTRVKGGKIPTGKQEKRLGPRQKPKQTTNETDKSKKEGDNGQKEREKGKTRL